MPGISRVGLRLVALMGVLAVIGVVLQIANAAQSPGRPAFTPAPQYSVWTRADAGAPRLNAVRGAPASSLYLYSYGAHPPARVSIARAETLAAYRPPYLYLLDEDGRVYGGNQESTTTRAYEKQPLRITTLGAGRGEIAAIMHWTQAPGEDPVLDPTDSPALVLSAMLTKKPLYVCDVWLPIRADSSFTESLGVLTFLADSIDRQIKALPKN